MPRMFIILFISYLMITINGISMNITEKDFSSSIEKILLINENLFIGTKNFLHRLSSKTFDQNRNSLDLTPQLDQSYHWKLLLSMNNEKLFICGTVNQGICQIIDQDFNVIINSSLPIVANDPVNSTVGLILPEENLIYIGVTYTNEGVSRWQIPNISGRSLNSSNFLQIYSLNNDDETISRDDLSLRFMPRQQTTFIVQYIFSFATKNAIYFLTNQPNDLDQTIIISKIIRFCRDKFYSIIRSYSELQLVCVNSNWILQSAQTIIDDNNQLILIGIFHKRDGSTGTNICSWRIEKDIEKGFYDNYQNCYSKGIGQRGLNFIKPNEPCRKDQSWSEGMRDDLCPRIISDSLPYPVGGINPIMGQLFYENSAENSSAFHLYSYGSSILFLQGLSNGTVKLGIFHFSWKINWISSYQLSTNRPIFSDILFDNQTGSFFLASGSKIFRFSLSDTCTAHLSCDECLSSSNNVICGWCSTIERPNEDNLQWKIFPFNSCTLSNNCPTNSWKQENNQCTHIINVQPLHASIDQSQWINLTLSKLPQLEHNEIYQCIFTNKFLSASTQAIKLDFNQLSCPTPFNYFQHQSVLLQMNNELKVRLSVIKSPSNTSIATVPEFILYNCSSYSSCESCRSIKVCQWCSDRCSSMCNEKSSNQCPSFNLVDPSNIFIESGQPIEIPLQFSNMIKSSVDCRLNETMVGIVDEKNNCRISEIPQFIGNNDQSMYLSVYQNNISIGSPIKMFLYHCNYLDSCEKCQSHRTCSWCQGKCASKTTSQCVRNPLCTSLRIEDFSPKIVPMNGKTIVQISLNGFINETISAITLADIPCLMMKSTNPIECQSGKWNSSRQGPIKIHFHNSVILFSKELIEYRQSSIISFNPLIVYEFGGEILHINGKNLILGNSQEIFIGNVQCRMIKQTIINTLTCRLPSMPSGFYNVTVRIDKQTILTNGILLQITPNPIVQDINPLVSFASGGRLVTIRGMYFASAQSILVQFSHRKWNAKLKINSNEILSVENGMTSSFTFRTPAIPTSSIELNSLPVDMNFSISFDDLIILSNLIEFHYISDVLLNISSIPPTLPYTGEELKLQVENLTEAASMEDIQLFIGCAECKLKSFTSKGITCQPPNELITNPQLLLDNQQHQVDCTISNSSIGPIRFRIGFREYLIGYLSYIHSSSLSSRYSVGTIVFLSFASCLLTIALLTFALCLYVKLRKTKEKSCSSSPIKGNEEHEKVFWSTATSAAAGPYYQVYEQIPSSSSHENTLTRASLLVCPYHHQYKQDYSTLLLNQPLKMNIPSLRTISIEPEQLKKLIFTSDLQCNSLNLRQSMELFYDLLGMNPFSEAFIDQLIVNNSHDLYQSYGYVFRYDSFRLKTFPLTRQISLIKLISSFFFQSKGSLIESFDLFDNLIDNLIHLIDNSPCDQLLNRSMNSLSSSTLLILPNLSYHSFHLSINYENLLHFNLPVFDCDSIDQIKNKLTYSLNSYEKLSHDQIDLLLPSRNNSLYSEQLPMIKHYFINSSILCRKKSSWKKSRDNNGYKYHLAMENQLINDQKLIEERLKANKNRLGEFWKHFYGEIIKGFKAFSIWEKQMEIEKKNSSLFKFYIEVISDLIRRLNLLIIPRSTCPIIQSCLNVIADGLEFIFQTTNQVNPQIKLLFQDEKLDFASFDANSFQIPSSSMINSLSLSTFDIRSVILEDDTAIQCLFQLYQFYELHSEPINQHIGENHVSVLLPVHHLLVQIRQLIHSDTMRTTYDEHFNVEQLK